MVRTVDLPLSAFADMWTTFLKSILAAQRHDRVELLKALSWAADDRRQQEDSSNMPKPGGFAHERIGARIGASNGFFIKIV